MATNNTGGGYNPTKAVLDALGTNYVVEKWVSDDGNQKYQRWADGKIEVWMKLQNGTSNGFEFTFPISFTELPIVKCNESDTSTAIDRFLYDGCKNLTTTGGKVLFVERDGIVRAPTNAILYAVGY